MKALPVWRKVLLILITVLTILRIGYIALRGEVDKEYITSTKYDLTEDVSPVTCGNASLTFTSSESRLYRLELLFVNLAEDKKGSIHVGLYSGDNRIYRSEIPLSDLNNHEWKTLYVNAPLSPGEEYLLKFNYSKECTQMPEMLVVNRDSAAQEILVSQVEDNVLDGQLAVNFGYLKNPGIFDKLVVIFLWVMAWVLLFLGLLYFDPLKQMILKWYENIARQSKPQIVLSVLELTACSIILNCSAIEFQPQTRIILYFLSLIAILNIREKTAYIHSVFNAGWKKALLVLLYVYAGFALTGQRILIYPLSQRLTVSGLFVFLCSVLWSVPVVQSILYYLDKLVPSEKEKGISLKTWQFTLLVVLILLIPAVLCLIAYNPAITSQDSHTAMISNAKNLPGVSDWIPGFYTLLIAAIEKVWDSPYALVLFQHTFWVYVMTELMLYLRKKGMRTSVLLALTLFSAFNAANCMHVNTLYKDIPYAYSLLWSLILIAKLTIDFEEYKGRWYIYLELILAFTGTFFYRKNGPVPFLLMAVPLAVVLRKNIKVLAAIAVTAALIFTIKGPVYRHFDIQSTGTRAMFMGLGQDILGAYYNDGEVSENTLRMIHDMTDRNIAGYRYNPTLTSQTQYLDITIPSFIWNYIDTFLKNPILVLRAFIAREDVVWDIFKGEEAKVGLVNNNDSVEQHPSLEKRWLEYYPARKYTSITGLVSDATAYTASSQWIRTIEWRCGLFVFLGLVSFLLLLCKKGKCKALLLITPVAGQILSLMLGNGYSDFRYFWPVNLLNAAMIPLILAVLKKEADQ